MTIAPNGKLYLLKGVKCDANYQNTLTWASKTAQYNYFSGLAFMKFEKASDTELTYINYAEGKIRVGVRNTKIYNCNYIMFQNPDFENKWFYAFVNNVEYVNNETSQINYTIDVMQTWYTDFSINKCFVEREHVSDDTIGKHTIDEGLPTGDIIYTNCTPLSGVGGKSFDTLSTIVEVSFNPNSSGVGTPEFLRIGGIFHGTAVIAFSNTQTDEFSFFLWWLNKRGLSEGVCSIYTYPECLLEYNTTVPYLLLTYEDSTGETQTKNLYVKLVKDVKTDMKATASVLPHLYNYTPNNNKLLTAPYNYLLLSNNVGGSVQLRYERMKDNTTLSVNYYGPLEGGANLIGEVEDYDSDGGDNGIVSLPVPALAQCSYAYDSYTNYLALNKSTLEYNKDKAAMSKTRQILSAASGAAGYIIQSGASYGGSLASDFLNGFSGAISIDTKIVELMTGCTALDGFNAGLEDSERKPNATIGTCSSSAAVMKQRNHLTVYNVSILPEYAKIIDNYLSMFGYKILREKTPETNSRKTWNYIKTQGATISGEIPADDTRAICKLLDRGITLWHNPTTMLDYSQDNSIIE